MRVSPRAAKRRTTELEILQSHPNPVENELKSIEFCAPMLSNAQNLGKFRVVVAQTMEFGTTDVGHAGAHDKSAKLKHQQR
jgi:hypothetical protein